MVMTKMRSSGLPPYGLPSSFIQTSNPSVAALLLLLRGVKLFVAEPFCPSIRVSAGILVSPKQLKPFFCEARCLVSSHKHILLKHLAP